MKYNKLIEKIYPGFPRQIGLPNRREVKSLKELMNVINIWNGKSRIFLSLYEYTFSNTHDFIIDKIWFDFDDCGYDNIIILHNWLLQKNYKHFIVFSGKGYHCYILTNKKELKNKKIALTNAQNYIINETKIEVDKQVIGDIARIVGIPGTFNCRRGRWAIFLTEEDLNKGEHFIFQKAETENIGAFEMFGKKKFDLVEYDTGISEYMAELSIADDFNAKINQDEILKGINPCIANILLQLKDLEHSYNERFIIIIYFLYELGYSETMVIDILKKFMTQKKFKHCIRDENQLKYLSKKIIMPVGCSKIKSLGYCPFKDKYCKNIKERLC